MSMQSNPYVKVNQMKYRKMGKHGIKLSEISIGTMYHGSHISEKQSHAVLEEALNQGINFIDCADRYGVFDSELPAEERTPAEVVLGKFLKNQDRDDLVVSSKIWFQMRESPNSGGLSRKHIKEGIRNTLANLGTDYIDIYFCHRSDRDTPLEETISTMTNLIDEGKVHYWGTSMWPPYLIERTISIAKEHGYIAPAVEEPPYHMMVRLIEADLIPMAKDQGLGLITFEALATGLLTGKYQQGIPEESREAVMHDLSPEVFERYGKVVPGLMELAKTLDIGMNHLAIAWTLRHPEISSSLMGARLPEQVKSNVEAINVQLSNETLEKIEEILGNRPRDFYR